MIYSGTTAPKSSTATVMTGTGTQIGTSAFNSGNDNPACVGYTYTAGEQHGNKYESKIKTTIDAWYKTTTLETNSATKILVADQMFCNDRSATTSSSGTPGEISGSMSKSITYYYGVYIRLITNKSPTLICPTGSDIFTVNTSNGNGALNYPVGLITADEVAMAGGVYRTVNSSYYLYTNTSYWTGSPYYFYRTGTYANGTYMSSSGYFSDDPVPDTLGTRPVISLSSSVKLSGDGTWNNVYTVS